MVDPFARLAEQLAVVDAFERGRCIHWADPLFRDQHLERKVVTSLVAQEAALRRDAGSVARGVLVIDLMASAGAIGAVDALRRTLPQAAEVGYVGFGVPLRGSRGLIERGLADVARRSPGPAMRCAFHSGPFFDLVRLEGAWSAMADHYDWILAVGFEGRVGRRGPAPLEPADLGRLDFVHSAVISFLDPAELAPSLPRLLLLASSIEQALEVEVEAMGEAGMLGLGRVEVAPGVDQEGARRELLDALDAGARFAHRARLRPLGRLRASGEVVEYLSAGFVEDHLLERLPVRRVVPAGAVRVAIVGR
jgi:hypothetical protein